MMKAEEIHIGRMIERHLQEHGIKQRWLARKVNVTPSNISKVLKRDHIDTHLLIRISQALKHDFLSEIVSALETELEK